MKSLRCKLNHQRKQDPLVKYSGFIILAWDIFGLGLFILAIALTH